MRLSITLILCLSLTTAHAQNVDSLKLELTKSNNYQFASNAKAIGTAYLRKNLYDSAERYLDIAIEMAKQINDHELVGDCFNNKGVSNYLRGRYKKSIISYQESITYYERTRNDTLIAQAMANLGLTFKGLNVYDQALEILYDAAKSLEELGLKKELSSSWNAIGNIHRELKNSQLAIDYLVNALNLRREINYEKGIAQSLHNIGIWHLTEKNYQSAYDSLIKAYQILTIIDKRTSSSTLAKLGEVALEMDSLTQAEEFFLESLRIRKEINEENGIAVSSNHLARLYIKTKRLDQAFMALQTANEYSSKSNSLDEISKTQALLRDFYTIKGLYNQALKYANLLIETRQKILDKEKTKSLVEAEIRYEVAKKETEIKEKESELELLEVRMIWLVSTIIILLVLVIVIGWLYVLSKKLSKERQSAQLRVEKLLKELNHRTKNHLQTQVSLIKLQSTFLKDGTAKSVMREVENRMKAITLIHQSLYDSSEELPEGINLSEYLRNLTENLMISFKYNRNRVSIEYDLDKIDTDVYTAVHVGLVVNEATTNAFKYAFTSEIKSPTLKLRLGKKTSCIIVVIQDNGSGFEMPKELNSETFGMTIMTDLAQQLDGELSIENKQGTLVRLKLPIK